MASAGYSVGRDKDACGRDGRPAGRGTPHAMDDRAVLARVQGRDGLIRRVRFFLPDAPVGVTVPVLGGFARLTWPAPPGPVPLPSPFELTCIHVCSAGRNGIGTGQCPRILGVLSQ